MGTDKNRWTLEIEEYAFTSKEYRQRLKQAREMFYSILGEELAKMKRQLPDIDWVVSEDLGLLVPLWQRLLKEYGKGPLLANDILALHGMIAGADGPIVLSREVVKEALMHPDDVYALPFYDADKKHLATVIHVGPNALKRDVRRLVKSLIEDPTGESSLSETTEDI